MFAVVERPSMARKPEPALEWDPDDDRVRRSFKKLLDHEPTRQAVRPSARDRTVSVTYRIPGALHELIELVCWEFRCSATEVVRAVLWERLLQVPTKVVLVEGRTDDEIAADDDSADEEGC